MQRCRRTNEQRDSVNTGRRGVSVEQNENESESKECECECE